MKLKSLALLSVVSALTACGINDEAHYDQPKDFGRTPAHLPVTNPVPEPTPETSVPTEAAVTVEVDGPVEEPPATSGHDLLGHYGFVGYFNTSSVARVLRGRGPDGQIETGGILAPVIKGIFELLTRDESDETLEIVVHEDGHTRQTVAQTAHTATGDFLSELKGDEVQSGTQTLSWPLPDDDYNGDCPRSFICVDRIVWKPEVGNVWTYCFKDLASGESVAVPYAPNTQFGEDAFRAAMPQGSLVGKPFKMTKHAGAIACEEASIAATEVSTLQWQLDLGDLDASRQAGFLKRAIHQPLEADSEIQVQYQPYRNDLRRTWQPKEAPFVDQISRFNTKVVYYLNSTDHAFVKIVRTVQTPMAIGFGNALEAVRRKHEGRFFSFVIDGVVSALKLILRTDRDTTGLQVDYVFEFCGHKAISGNLFDHCTGRARP